MASYGATKNSLRTTRTPVSPPRPGLLVRAKSAVFHEAASRHFASGSVDKEKRQRPQTACLHTGSQTSLQPISHTQPQRKPQLQSQLKPSHPTLQEPQLSAKSQPQLSSHSPTCSQPVSQHQSSAVVFQDPALHFHTFTQSSHHQPSLHDPFPQPPLSSKLHSSATPPHLPDVSVCVIEDNHQHCASGNNPPPRACLSVPPVQPSHTAFTPTVPLAHRSWSAGARPNHCTANRSWSAGARPNHCTANRSWSAGARPNHCTANRSWSAGARPNHCTAHRSWSVGARPNHCTANRCLAGVGSSSNGRCQSGLSQKSNVKNTQCDCNSALTEVNTWLKIDSLRVGLPGGGGLLGKITSPAQPSAASPTVVTSVSTVISYPTCPSPPKTPTPSLCGTESAMPTNQSSPWGSGKLRAGPKAATSTTTPTKPTAATKVPSDRQGVSLQDLAKTKDSAKAFCNSSQQTQKTAASPSVVKVRANGDWNYNKAAGVRVTVLTQQQRNGIQTQGVEQRGQRLADPRLVERSRGSPITVPNPPPPTPQEGHLTESVRKLTSDLSFQPNNETRTNGTLNDTRINGTLNDTRINGTLNDTRINGTLNDTRINGTLNDTRINGTLNDTRINGTLNDTRINGTLNDTRINGTLNDTRINGTLSGFSQASVWRSELSGCGSVSVSRGQAAKMTVSSGGSVSHNSRGDPGAKSPSSSPVAPSLCLTPSHHQGASPSLCLTPSHHQGVSVAPFLCLTPSHHQGVSVAPFLCLTPSHHQGASPSLCLTPSHHQGASLAEEATETGESSSHDNTKTGNTQSNTTAISITTAATTGHTTARENGQSAVSESQTGTNSQSATATKVSQSPTKSNQSAGSQSTTTNSQPTTRNSLLPTTAEITIQKTVSQSSTTNSLSTTMATSSKSPTTAATVCQSANSHSTTTTSAINSRSTTRRSSHPAASASVVVCLHPGAVPAVPSAVCLHPGAVPAVPSAVCLHPGAVPAVPSAVCLHPGAVPAVPSAVCLHPGAVPAVPSAVCLHPGAVPAVPSAVCLHPGAVPAVPSAVCLHPAVPSAVCLHPGAVPAVPSAVCLHPGAVPAVPSAVCLHPGAVPAVPSAVCLHPAVPSAVCLHPGAVPAVPSAVCLHPGAVPAVPSASVCATQKRGTERNARQDTTSAPVTASVGSVTNQISAIHLTKQGPSASSSSSSSSSPSKEHGLVETELSGQECVAMQVDGEEEEFPDDLENDCSDDDGSDCSSSNDASSTASFTLFSGLSIEEPMVSEVADSREEKPALVTSMFPHCPSTLYFSTTNERVEMLPVEQRRLLKWKMSTVTPNVVKHTVARSHFKVTKRSHDWLGCWGHHMKSPGFKAIREHQKLNHFPGSFQIGRKDRLWRNLSKMQARFGKREFSFFPRSFILPQDIKLLRKAWEDSGSKQKWIIKPPASARGIGIQVIHKWSQMPRKRPLLVQKYLHKPYLISGNKFDLRIYVYVTSYDPLRVYIFSDGLVRFASCKYSSSMKSLSNKFMHLTNYSVNKKNSEYQTNTDNKACQGHKWALKALWQYLGSKGVNTTLIWEKIKDIVIKTIIASDPYVNTLLKMHLRSAYSCHELFGFDIMLDENLKPWVLEVNISPSLHSNTALDVAIKGQMIRDVLNLAGFLLPQREAVVAASCSSGSSSTSSLCGRIRDKTRADLSTDEKVKRAFYLTQRFADQDFYSTVLDVMTPEDVRVLAESEDELSRKGEFERVFPSPSSSRYLRFFECPRYLNLLLDQWEQRHWQNRSKGISLLRSLCQRRVHLGTTDPAHIWSKCSYVSRFEPHRQDHSRSSVVVSRQSQADSDGSDDGSDPEIQSVVSSMPDVSLPGSPSPADSRCPTPNPSPNPSSNPSPNPSLSQSLPPGDFL